MSNVHEPYYWFAGDDWQINALLLDSDGIPFNLTSATIKWVLVNEAGERVLDEGDVSITVTDAEGGLCSIQVPSDKTSPLKAGRYSDRIGILDAGLMSTLAHGLDWVDADPWAAP